jgi:hypothetical protein
MKKYIVLITMLPFIGACSTLVDSNKPTEQQNSEAAIQSMDHKSSFFVARKGVKDGYVFIFHIMPAPEGKGYSRTNYHLMVSVEKGRQPITNLKLYSDVTHPDGSAQTGTPMIQMGDWYMLVYNLDHEQPGRHWITATFELSGKTYSSGIYYPETIIR